MNSELHRVDAAVTSLPSAPATANTPSARLAFATQSRIAAGGRDDEYFVYYGNPNAGRALGDPGAVYLWYDDFRTDTRARYLMQKGVDVHGDPLNHAALGYDPINRRAVIDTGDNYQSDFYPASLRVTDAIVETTFVADLNYAYQTGCD